jgi:hypothetical protein
LSQKLLGEYLPKISQHFDFQQFVCKSDEVTVQYQMENECQICAENFQKNAATMQACWGTCMCQLKPESHSTYNICKVPKRISIQTNADK